MHARCRWTCWAALAAVLAPAEATAEVEVARPPQPFEIKADDWSARIDPDGCLTQLNVGGFNFLAPGASISRGSYFFKDGVLDLGMPESSKPGVIVAGNEKAGIRYEFSEDRTEWVLNNRSDDSLVFFLVCSPFLEAIAVDDGPFELPAAGGDAKKALLVTGEHALSITGLDKVWGPWQGPHQVLQVTLEAGAERTLVLTPGRPSARQRARIVKLRAPAEEADLTIRSPREYEVIQRDTVAGGAVLISGRVNSEADSVEVTFAGDSAFGELPAEALTLPVGAKSRQFNASVRLPAGGWYEMTVEAQQDGETVAESSVTRFGVGEVFVGAGQSNSTNCGQFKTTQATGMVSSFGGKEWQLADDPQPGVADRTQGGSFWPAFGDALYEKFGVPIGVATTGFGGTSVNQWQPDGDLFRDWTMTRVHQLGPRGFRALLWHQGEADVYMPSEEYFQKLKNTITASREHAGWEFPWFVAQTSYHNPKNPSFESVRSAQARLWEEGVALEGPDTDTLTGDHRDFDGKGIHFSPKGLKAHGEMWAEVIGEYLDQILVSGPAQLSRAGAQ